MFGRYRLLPAVALTPSRLLDSIEHSVCDSTCFPARSRMIEMPA